MTDINLPITWAGVHAPSNDSIHARIDGATVDIGYRFDWNGDPESGPSTFPIDTEHIGAFIELLQEVQRTVQTEEDRDALAKEHATASKTEPLAKETIMPEPTEEHIFTTSIEHHEIHGPKVEIFSHWSKESVQFPVKHLTALIATLTALAEDHDVEDEHNR